MGKSGSWGALSCPPKRKYVKITGIPIWLKARVNQVARCPSDFVNNTPEKMTTQPGVAC